jgi:hypothetical protein
MVALVVVLAAILWLVSTAGRCMRATHSRRPAAGAGDYAHLFRDEFSDATDANQLFEIATAAGRTIISAKGGSGKSSIARRGAALGSQHNIRTFFVDMKKWSPSIQAL